jgi:hypothetical protein
MLIVRMQVHSFQNSYTRYYSADAHKLMDLHTRYEHVMIEEPAPVLAVFDDRRHSPTPSKRNMVDIGIKQRNGLYKCHLWSFNLWDFTLIHIASPALVDLAMYILQRSDLPSGLN